MISDSLKKAAKLYREQFKDQRKSTLKRVISASQELDALVVLGFVQFPSELQLKERFHALAKEHHPDSGKGQTELFKSIAAAYKLLKKRYHNVSC